MEVLIMQFPPACPKYSSQNPIHIHPELYSSISSVPKLHIHTKQEVTLQFCVNLF
jgi:hypothetical protein